MNSPALQARGLVKRFGESLAVDGVDLDLKPGRVLGLVGENGAGKSTLLNILSCIARQDAGSVVLAGQTTQPADYAAAQRLGLARVFQEQALIGNVPVYENLLMGSEGRFTRFGQFIDRKAMIALAEEMIDEAGARLDVRKTTSDLSFSQRQVVEIIRACLAPRRLFGVERPIVLLDEPTASLERGDERIFLRLVEQTRVTGALLFVSHRLGEVLSLSDEIMVLKDGRAVGTVEPRDVDERDLHRLMVGRERDRDYYHEDRQRGGAGAAPAFAARAMTRSGAYHGVSLEIRAGEILGVGGLLESGKSDLGKGLAGVAASDSGEVSMGAGAWRRPGARALIGAGLGYVPAERLAEGMIASQPISWNISLPSGDLFSTALGLWRPRRERRVSMEMIERVGVKADGPEAPCDRLSGGNQQKVVLGRWLARDLGVLILDNPTRGVDAGAKEEIYRLIRDLTDTGVAILLITDELMELIGLSDRIAIMRKGRITRVIPAPAHEKPSEQALVEAMLTAAPELEAAA
ncbi:sugar ABC transporter ATP-binding protein [Pikeienuella sp. HZG-20]|uniref:sugar ABC transporter ATP-binding protein n=1 Tax=Paludibacillus litoralis TaxID=3133267 RepID=UPI0030EC106F